MYVLRDRNDALCDWLIRLGTIDETVKAHVTRGDDQRGRATNSRQRYEISLAERQILAGVICDELMVRRCERYAAQAREMDGNLDSFAVPRDGLYPQDILVLAEAVNKIYRTVTVGNNPEEKMIENIDAYVESPDIEDTLTRQRRELIKQGRTDLVHESDREWLKELLAEQKAATDKIENLLKSTGAG